MYRITKLNIERTRTKPNRELTPITAKELNANLISAAMLGKAEVVKTLLAGGADIEAKDNFRNTPLMLAASNGRKEVVKILLDREADIKAKNNFGQTALMCAAMCSKTEVVNALLDKGADIEAKNNVGQTTLIMAARSGKKEVAKALLAGGADIEAKDNLKKTTLMEAATYCPSLVNALLNAGATIQAALPYSGVYKVCYISGDADYQAYNTDAVKPHVVLHNPSVAMLQALPMFLDEGAETKNYKQIIYLSVVMAEPLVAERKGRIKTVRIIDLSEENHAYLPAPEEVVKLGLRNFIIENLAYTQEHYPHYYMASYVADKIKTDWKLIPQNAYGLIAENIAFLRSVFSEGGIFEASREKFEAFEAVLAQRSKPDGALFKAFFKKPGKLLLQNTKETIPQLSDKLPSRILECFYPKKFAAQVSNAIFKPTPAKESTDEGASESKTSDGESLESSTLNETAVPVTGDSWRGTPGAGGGGGSGTPNETKLSTTEVKYHLGRTPLHKAAEWNNLISLTTLLDRGADIEAQDDFRNTPLMLAAMYGKTAVVKILLDRGADIDAQNKCGDTSLIGAARRGEIEAMKILLYRGANIDAQNKWGDTALLSAGMCDDPKVAKILLDAGAALPPSRYCNPQRPTLTNLQLQICRISGDSAYQCYKTIAAVKPHVFLYDPSTEMLEDLLRYLKENKGKIETVRIIDLSEEMTAHLPELLLKHLPATEIVKLGLKNFIIEDLAHTQERYPHYYMAGYVADQIKTDWKLIPLNAHELIARNLSFLSSDFSEGGIFEAAREKFEAFEAALAQRSKPDVEALKRFFKEPGKLLLQNTGEITEDAKGDISIAPSTTPLSDKLSSRILEFLYPKEFAARVSNAIFKLKTVKKSTDEGASKAKTPNGYSLKHYTPNAAVVPVIGGAGGNGNPNSGSHADKVRQSQLNPQNFGRS